MEQLGYREATILYFMAHGVRYPATAQFFGVRSRTHVGGSTPADGCGAAYPRVARRPYYRPRSTHRAFAGLVRTLPVCVLCCHTGRGLAAVTPVGGETDFHRRVS